MSAAVWGEPAAATRVLLTTDGSALAAEGMRRAVHLLGRGARYRLLHVEEPAPAVSPSGRFAAPAVAEIARRRIDERAQEAIGSTIGRLPVEADPVVELGRAPDVICRVAERERCDVIVVAARGAGFLERVLLGSVSGHVVQHAPCSVLVVRGE